MTVSTKPLFKKIAFYLLSPDEGILEEGAEAQRKR